MSRVAFVVEACYELVNVPLWRKRSDVAGDGLGEILDLLVVRPGYQRFQLLDKGY